MAFELPSTTPALVGLAFVTSYALTALARRIAHPLGLLDRPDGRRKIHAGAMPVLGGASVFAALLATILLGPLLGLGDVPGLLFGAGFVPLFVSAALACGLGLWDDKRPLRARHKLLLQFAASLPFIVWGRSIDSIHLLGWDIELGLAGYAFTAFWLVACANAINLIDGLDGLAGTAGLIITASIAALAAMKGAAGATMLALLFAACLGGFLLHNWPPARIFLGDSGSLLIGFVVGTLSIEASLKTTTGFALAVPLVLLSVPVFDTAMAIARRLLSGRGIGEGDRQHIHHRLQARGLSRAQALLAISGLCTAMAAVTLLSARFHTDVVALGMCGFLLALLVYGRVFGYDETLLFLRRLRDLADGLAALPARREVRRLLRRMASAGPQDGNAEWYALVAQLERVGVERVDLSVRAAASSAELLRRAWRLDGRNEQALTGWRFRYSVARDDGTLAIVEADGRSATSAEQFRLAGVLDALVAFCAEFPQPVAEVPRLEIADDLSPSVITLPERPASDEQQPEQRVRRVA